MPDDINNPAPEVIALGICEEFLRTASPEVRAELDAFLARRHPTVDANWLIDMVSFHAFHHAASSVEAPS